MNRREVEEELMMKEVRRRRGEEGGREGNGRGMYSLSRRHDKEDDHSSSTRSKRSKREEGDPVNIKQEPVDADGDNE